MATEVKKAIEGRLGFCWAGLFGLFWFCLSSRIPHVEETVGDALLYQETAFTDHFQILSMAPPDSYLIFQSGPI